MILYAGLFFAERVESGVLRVESPKGREHRISLGGAMTSAAGLVSRIPVTPLPVRMEASMPGPSGSGAIAPPSPSGGKFQAPTSNIQRSSKVQAPMDLSALMPPVFPAVTTRTGYVAGVARHVVSVPPPIGTNGQVCMTIEMDVPFIPQPQAPAPIAVWRYTVDDNGNFTNSCGPNITELPAGAGPDSITRCAENTNCSIWLWVIMPPPQQGS